MLTDKKKAISRHIQMDHADGGILLFCCSCRKALMKTSINIQPSRPSPNPQRSCRIWKMGAHLPFVAHAFPLARASRNVSKSLAQLALMSSRISSTFHSYWSNSSVMYRNAFTSLNCFSVPNVLDAALLKRISSNGCATIVAADDDDRFSDFDFVDLDTL